MTTSARSGRSNTWRFSTPVADFGPRDEPQRPQTHAVCSITQSGSATCRNVAPLWPFCPPLGRPDAPRRLPGTRGFAFNPSLEGGRELFELSCPNCRRRSATSASSAAIWRFSEAINSSTSTGRTMPPVEFRFAARRLERSTEQTHFQITCDISDPPRLGSYKPFVSLGEMNPFAFAVFPPRPGPKRKGREIDGGFGARAADVARGCDSEMAPQAIGIAQNGLGNGAVGSRLRGQREPIMRISYQSLTTVRSGAVGFFMPTTW